MTETPPEVAREIILDMAWEACRLAMSGDEESGLPLAAEEKLVELNEYVCATLGIPVPDSI